MNDFTEFLSKEGITGIEGHRNPTDYEKFFKLQEGIEKNMEEVNRDRIFQERKKNLYKWTRSLPSRWRTASLQSIDTESSQEVAEKLKKYPRGSFYFKGGPGVGKTFLAYATLRRMIGLGRTSPSRIKILSEDTILGYAKGGFRGRDQFNELFDPLYNVYVLDNIGGKEYYDEKEITFWEQIIDHVYTNSLTAIFISSLSASRFSKILSDSTTSKLSFLIEDRIITVTGNKAPVLDESPDINILDNFEG